MLTTVAHTAEYFFDFHRAELGAIVSPCSRESSQLRRGLQESLDQRSRCGRTLGTLECIHRDVLILLVNSTIHGIRLHETGHAHDEPQICKNAALMPHDEGASCAVFIIGYCRCFTAAATKVTMYRMRPKT